MSKVDGAYKQEFKAQVVSEDAGQPLLEVLLIDYGIETLPGQPWREAQPGPKLPPKSLADGPRSVRHTWNAQVALGCHTVTMLVTHEVRGGGLDFFCPLSADDFDTLTWVVSLCDEVKGECDFSGCPVHKEGALKSYCDTVGELPNSGT